MTHRNFPGSSIAHLSTRSMRRVNLAMPRIARLTVAIALIACAVGCEQKPPTVANVEEKTSNVTVSHEASPSAATQDTPPATDTLQEPSVTQKASELFEKAKSTGNSTVRGAGKWMQDTLDNAVDSTNSTAEDSMKWANDTYESLKKQGLTSANSTSEWLSQDWNNMDAWQYKVISIGPLDDDELTQQLNGLGSSGWECFHIETGQSTRMFFKKPSESYLRRLPFRDLIKLAPLLDQGQ